MVEASQALGVAPARIAKTLSLRVGDRVVLVCARGDARLSNGKAKAALGGPMERGPATAPPRSVAEVVKRIEADYEGEPYFLTGRMDAGCCQ